MAASPRRSSGPVLRSVSPAGRFHSSTSSTSRRSSPFASSTSTFAPHCSSTFLHRSSSPTRVNMLSSNPSSSSVRFSLDRSVSPNRSISMLNQNQNHAVQKPGKYSVPAQRKACMCSPTNHPGSFRCSLHRNLGNRSGTNQTSTASYSSNQLNMRRSAMTNSLVRIGTVEGELVKRALAALIRPSSHSQRRREDFKLRPSWLSVMSKAGDA